MSKFSPESGAFDPSMSREAMKTDRPIAEEEKSPEQLPFDLEQITRDSDELLRDFQDTTGEDPAKLVASGEPQKLVEAGDRFLSGLLKKHPHLRKAAAVTAVLSGLFANGCAANQRLCARIEMWDQGLQEKESFRREQWEWIRDEIKKAHPEGGWVVRKYNGFLPGWYFEMPAGAYRPYGDWTKGRVAGDILPTQLGQPDKQSYAMKTPPAKISNGDFLMLTTGHLDYIKEDNDSRIRLVYSPGEWLLLGEIQDQQAGLVYGPQEYRLYPHSSKAYPDKPWGTMPTLKPKGDTYEELWTQKLGRSTPRQMTSPAKR